MSYRKVKIAYLHNSAGYHIPEIGQLDTTLVASGYRLSGDAQQKDHGFDLEYDPTHGGTLRIRFLGKFTKKPMEAEIPGSNFKCIIYSSVEETETPKPKNSK